MNRRTISRLARSVGAIAVLILLLAILSGCGDEAADTSDVTQDGMTSSTTATMETQTTMSSATSMGPETAASNTTSTASEMGGANVPPAQPGSYIDLTPDQAKQLIDTTPDLVVIDVSPHYDEGHLPGAVSYYLGDGSLQAAIPALNRDVPYLVYCHVDSVAIAGAQALVDAGFPTVYRLEGNYAAWVSAGYPVEK